VYHDAIFVVLGIKLWASRVVSSALSYHYSVGTFWSQKPRGAAVGSPGTSRLCSGSKDSNTAFVPITLMLTGAPESLELGFSEASASFLVFLTGQVLLQCAFSRNTRAKPGRFFFFCYLVKINFLLKWKIISLIILFFWV
jgi:hypothetical protein